MEIANILASLRRSKLGAILVAAQVAVTLAIVSNAVFIAGRHLERMSHPSGLPESEIFSFRNQWIGTPQNIDDLIRVDLETMRSTPGVVDALRTDFVPLSGPGESWLLARRPPNDPEASKHPATTAAMYWTDEHGLRALGLRLLAGRWFTRDEVRWQFVRPPLYPQVIVTRAAAEALFPEGGALGSVIYTSGTPSTVIGIVDTLQNPWANDLRQPAESSILVPWERTGVASAYIVRTLPGQVNSVMHDIERKLRAVQAQRVISELKPFTETRWEAYRNSRSLAWTFAAVCLLLLLVTGLGIVGLTSYWIAQRRHHIGMRRALGARRSDILKYYQTENLLIAGAGAALGIALAVSLNLWLAKNFAIQRIDTTYILIGAVAVLLLGQLSAFWPAPRACGSRSGRT